MISKLKKLLLPRRRYEIGESIKLYRCTECGYISLSIGRLHAHIETHRKPWRIWRAGWDTKYLIERTERLWLEPIDREPKWVKDEI